MLQMAEQFKSRSLPSLHARLADDAWFQGSNAADEVQPRHDGSLQSPSGFHCEEEMRNSRRPPSVGSNFDVRVATPRALLCTDRIARGNMPRARAVA